jgi:hypothetical protein
MLHNVQGMTAELEQKQEDKVIHVYGEDAFYVKSDSKDTYYKVEFKATCECPHFQYRGRICKHIKKVFGEEEKK